MKIASGPIQYTHVERKTAVVALARVAVVHRKNHVGCVAQINEAVVVVVGQVANQRRRLAVALIHTGP